MKSNSGLVIWLAISMGMVSPAWAARSAKPVAAATVAAETSVTLDTAEADMLLLMREEEKVARDVYRLMYQLWGKPVFRNIAASEQRHMDALLKKIDLYGLTDPAPATTGLFTNPDMQALYDSLTAQGRLSVAQALVVGATIEDKDIRDISAAIAETDELALKMTYSNLLEGSKNHLRAFVKLLTREGIDYRPQFISQAEFDAIVGI